MNSGNLWFILKILPLLAFCAILFGLLGWWLRSLFRSNKSETQTVITPANDQGSREKLRKLEEKLRTTEGNYDKTRSELLALQKSAIAPDKLETALSETAKLRTTEETLRKQVAALDAELKTNRASLASLNANLNDQERAQKDRYFQLENELSKAREELALLNTETDDSAELRAELERVRENLASTTRLTGELRRSEAAAVEALAACKANYEKLKSESGAKPAGAQSLLRGIGPVVRPESDRVAAAKAQVEQFNKNREETKSPVSEPKPAKAPIAQAEFSDILPLAGLATPEAKASKLDDASKIFGKRVSQDDLTIVEGIGPKINELLGDAGINDWATLADSQVSQLQGILTAKGGVYEIQDPTTWPLQSKMARDGKWAELKAWQDKFNGTLESVADPSAEPKAKKGAVIETATQVLGKKVLQDDLEIVEGIGPKIEGILEAAGILTWANLADAPEERLKGILENEGGMVALRNPATWPKQAALARDGQWEELKAWQDQLSGGNE